MVSDHPHTRTKGSNICIKEDGRDVITANVSCDLCNGEQNLPPLVGIALKVSENLGATVVAPVAPVVTSLRTM